MRKTFIIPCKFIASKPVIYDCVQSINNTYGNSAEIIVIDSDSSDKSYFPILRELGVIVDDAVNQHYISGAIWYAFEKYARDYYCIVHDSMVLKKTLDQYDQNDVTSIRYFNSGRFFRNAGGGVNLGEFGFDNLEQFTWVEEQLFLHTSYSIPDRFTGLFGSALLCKRETLEKLHNKGFSKVLPCNKLQDQGMERAWGIVLTHEEYDIKKHTVAGDHNRNPDNSIIEKIHLSNLRK